MDLQKSLELMVEKCDKAFKPCLSERMEIAFYNVIDHRCDKGEEINAPVESICKNISDYTEKFIAGHEMSECKEKELRHFVGVICEIISTPPRW